jgi:hypothetical protein
MTSIVVQLTAETEQQLRMRASQCGQTLETYLRQLAENHARAETHDMLSQGLAWLRQRGADDVRKARDRILRACPPPRDVPMGKTALDVLEGSWPGAETDAEIRDALDRIS